MNMKILQKSEDCVKDESGTVYLIHSYFTSTDLPFDLPFGYSVGGKGLLMVTFHNSLLMVM